MTEALGSPRWERVAELFDGLRGLDSAERAARLAELAAEDPELATEADALLRAADAEGLLDSPAAEALATLAEQAAESKGPTAVGERIGPYRLVEEIGRGGMGVVYLGERVEGGFEQQVAVKLIKRGLDTDEILWRFRHERQVLARLDHRAIAKLFDGGATADGRPYLVMELVAGQPITAWCDAHRYTVEGRVALFCRVCEAVHHAHRSLVVHRDLKPANILVTDNEELKLLDFGLAKVLAEDPEGLETPTVTRLGLRAMTPEYAAPEQVLGGAVSTATDVYSLGVVLYELLTGRRPYRLGKHFGAEAERTILEVEPDKPSEVVEDPVEAEGRPSAEELAAARGLAPGALRRRLAGDLDAIVLTALRKEPERRYGSAQALAEDLQRHLTGQPVTARPEGRWYRTQKFVRRHRVGVTAGAALLTVLVGSSIVSTVLYLRAVAARRESEAARQEAVDEARRAEASKLLALARLRLEDHPTAALAYTIASLERADQPAARRFAVEVLWRGPPAIYLIDPRGPLALGGSCCTAFSPDGEWLAATLGFDGRFALWSEDGGEPKLFDDQGRNLLWLRFGPASDVLAATRENGARILSVPSGRLLRTIDAGQVVRVMDSHVVVRKRESRSGPGGHEISDDVFEAWPIEGGGGAPFASVRGVNVSYIASDGSYLFFTRGRDAFVQPLGEAADGSPRKLGSHRDLALGPAHPYPDVVASRDLVGEIVRWRPFGGGRSVRALGPVGFPGGEERFAIDPEGSVVAASTGNTMWLRTFEGPPDREPLVLRAGGGPNFSGVALHPSGHWLATASDEGGAHIWPLARQYSHVHRLPGTPWWKPRFSRDGRWLAVRTGKGAWIWSLYPNNDGPEARLVEGVGLSPRLVPHPSGEYLLAGRETLWEIPWEGGAPRHVPGSGLLAMSADGRMAAFSAREGETEEYVIRVEDLLSGATWEKTTTHLADTSLFVAVTPSGSLLSAGQAGLVMTPFGGDPRLLLDSVCDGLDLGPDGRSVLAAVGGDAVLVDLESGEHRAVASLGSEADIADVAFDPSGTIGISADRDGVLRVAPIAGGSGAHLLFGHEGNLAGVAVSPDGRWIASTGYDDESVRLWPMPEGQPFHTLPYDEFLTRLEALTNLRAVPDPEAEDGYRLEVGPFPGWKTAPTW